jgi:hypothetical protein
MAERSNLPAPYESPWRQLGRSLQAVAASLRLDARGLWRRNQAGELPRPLWCPQALGPLFWPMVLVMALALLGVLGRVLTHPGPRPDTAEPMPALEAPPRESAVPEPPSANPLPAPENVLPPPAAVAEQPKPDPLLEQLSEGLEPELIDAARANAARANPEQASLTLELSSAFGQLDPRRQRRLAEGWLERSLELGFEHLELVDQQGQLLGYRARVGSGMILLNPEATS